LMYAGNCGRGTLTGLKMTERHFYKTLFKESDF